MGSELCGARINAMRPVRRHLRTKIKTRRTDPLLPSAVAESPVVRMLKTGREVAVMSLSPDAVHLPKCPIEPARYDRLYAFNQNVDDQLPASADWKEMRIRGDCRKSWCTACSRQRSVSSTAAT